MNRNSLVRYINVNTVIIALEVIWWVILNLQGSTLDGEFMVEHGALYTPYVVSSEWYRLFTACLLHFDMAHFAGNMFAQYFLGNYLLKAIKSGKFVLIYFLSGVAGNLLFLVISLNNLEYSVSAGASGAVYGLMGALFMVVIKNGGRFGSISLKRMVLAVVIYVIYSFTTPQINGWAHMGGIITGFLVTGIIYPGKRA